MARSRNAEASGGVAPAVEPVTPESPVSPPEESAPPAQVQAGTVDLWPVLRDPEAAAAALRGELDEILHELHRMARSHGAADLVAAIIARALHIRLPLDAAPPRRSPDPKPFRWPHRSRG